MEKLLKMLLVAAFLNGLSWILVVPIWQYPDEQAHFAQVQDIAEVGKSIRGVNTSQEVALSEKFLQTERDGLGSNKFTYHPEFKLNYSQNFFGPREKELSTLPKESRKTFIKSEATVNPPLYYFLSAQIYILFYNFDLFTRIFALRIFSSLLFLLLILVAYKIGKEVFPQKNKYPLIIASVVAFLPMLVFSSTGILPDPLTNLLFSIIILLSIRTLIYGISKKTTVSVIIVLFLATLTRQHLLIGIPIILLPFAYQLIKVKGGYKVIALILILTSLIIYLSNVFTNLPILTNLRIPDLINISPKLLFQKNLLDHITWTLSHTYHEVLPWFWGVYRWLSLTLPHAIYRVINVLTILSIAGVIWHFVKVLKKRKISQTDLSLIFFAVSIGIYFISFVIWDYFFRIRNNYSFGIQGRYFFPLIIPLMSFMVIGLKEVFELFFKRFSKYFPIFFVGLMILFNDFSLIFVAKSYYSFEGIKTFIIEASQYKPLIFKGYIIYLILLSSAVVQLLFIYSIGKITLKMKIE
jgi:hypothetical protein